MLRHVVLEPRASLGAEPSSATAATAKPSPLKTAAFVGVGGAGLYLLLKDKPLAGIGLMGVALLGGGLLEHT